MTKPVALPAGVLQKHLQFLDDLRESGATNMFGAAPYVAEAFGLQAREARTIVLYWMETFGERHPQD